jgi:hypothetical protein
MCGDDVVIAQLGTYMHCLFLEYSCARIVEFISCEETDQRVLNNGDGLPVVLSNAF